MFKYIVTDSHNIVKYESIESYNNKQAAIEAGYDYLDTWELINETHGKVDVIEINGVE